MTSTIWMRDGKAVGYYDPFDNKEDEDEDNEEVEYYYEDNHQESDDDEKKEKQSKDENPETKYLFYELLKIVNDGFEEKITEKLKKPFLEIANKNEDDWKELCNWDIESTLESKCRQDLVPNGVKPDYSHQELTQYVPSSTSFNAYQHYDVNEYLSKLLLTAHTVDEAFQKSVQMIFQIDLETDVSTIKELNDMQYQRGPIKLLSRCKAKAETDYSDQPFPSSACILDMNRCALIFQDIGSMLKALELINNKISFFQSGNIVAICRDKNGFREYSHDRPDYADIKLNVLIKGVKYNIIGEVQCMVQQMMNFKHSAHSLYSVIRRKEFVDNFVKILPLKTNLRTELITAAASVDFNALCDLIVTQGLNDEELLTAINDDDNTIIFSIFKNLHYKSKEKAAIKCFKLLLNTVNQELLEKRIYDEDDSIENLDGIFALGHNEMTELLFSKFPTFETFLREEENAQEICTMLLVMDPEPKRCKNLMNLLGFDEKLLIEWIKNDPDGAETVTIPLQSKYVDTIKYLLSLIPTKLGRFKFLNSGNNTGHDENGKTLLTEIFDTGAVAVQTLLQAFELQDRLDLIEKANLVFYATTQDEWEIPKVIIDSINDLPTEQLKYLTQKYDDNTLLEMEIDPEFAKWIKNKIQILQQI